MVDYNLNHLTQPPEQFVLGPIQDDEALMLYALIRTVHAKNILEVGFLGGYSATNFLRAVGPDGKVFSVDQSVFMPIAKNHFPIVKNCKDLDPADITSLSLDLVFFDCHDFDSQMKMFETLELSGKIDSDTFLVFHDTGLHSTKVMPNSKPIRGGWQHQDAERRMVNELVMRRGYSSISFHGSLEGPMRHGLSILQRFFPFEV